MVKEELIKLRTDLREERVLARGPHAGQKGWDTHDVPSIIIMSESDKVRV
jgi:hypothetical protein